MFTSSHIPISTTDHLVLLARPAPFASLLEPRHAQIVVSSSSQCIELRLAQFEFDQGGGCDIDCIPNNAALYKVVIENDPVNVSREMKNVCNVGENISIYIPHIFRSSLLATADYPRPYVAEGQDMGKIMLATIYKHAPNTGTRVLPGM